MNNVLKCFYVMQSTVIFTLGLPVSLQNDAPGCWRPGGSWPNCATTSLRDQFSELPGLAAPGLTSLHHLQEEELTPESAQGGHARESLPLVSEALRSDVLASSHRGSCGAVLVIWPRLDSACSRHTCAEASCPSHTNGRLHVLCQAGPI